MDGILRNRVLEKTELHFERVLKLCRGSHALTAEGPDSLIRELRSLKPRGMPKKKNKQTAGRNVDFRGIASKGSGQEECD